MSKKQYVMVLDTETCNGLDLGGGKTWLNDSLVYDCGFSINDLSGNTYEEHSYVVKELFLGRRDLMKSCYYAEKIPSYWTDIWAKKRRVIDFMEMRKQIIHLIYKYNIKAIVAHNARFDVRVLNNTVRYLTHNKIMFFFPKRVEIWDTMEMAKSVILPKRKYVNFCEDNAFMTKHKTPRPQLTAEVVYRFMTNNVTFEESHTGLEDVQIEREIMWYAYRQKQAMNKAITIKPDFYRFTESRIHI